jgi:hypothetical protein
MLNSSWDANQRHNIRKLKKKTSLVSLGGYLEESKAKKNSKSQVMLLPLI